MYRDILLAAIVAFVCVSCGGTKPDKRETPSNTLPPPGADSRPVIVAFGDSLTVGAGVDPAASYPAKLQKKIDDAGYRYRVVNAGVSGDTSAQGLNRISTVIAHRPAVAIVEFGANDGLRGVPSETTKQNLESIVRQLQSAGAQVILAGMQIPPNYGMQYAKAFRSIFPEVADTCDASLIPFFLQDVGGRADLNLDDGIHPNADGYDIVAENVWRILKPLL